MNKWNRSSEKMEFPSIELFFDENKYERGKSKLDRDRWLGAQEKNNQTSRILFMNVEKNNLIC